MEEFITKVTNILNEFKDVENKDNLEIEFRLGFFEEEELLDDDEEEKILKFNSYLDKEFYDKIYNKLNSNKKWENITKESVKDYFHNGMRLTVDTNTKKKKCIIKKKLHTIDYRFEGTPFDVRVCISEEKPIRISDFPRKLSNLYSREKDRISFKHKIWNYDITKVSTLENTILETKYEVELEASTKDILNSNNIKYFIHSSLLKINDLIFMCEKELKDNQNDIEIKFLKEFKNLKI